MRLHMLQRYTLSGCECFQGTGLIGDIIFDLLQRGIDISTPESDQIRKPGMGARGHAMFFGNRNGAPHDVGVAGMKTAGDIG